MTDRGESLNRARQAVADRYTPDYMKRAIMAGEWDAGSLVQNELARLTAEEGDAGAEAAPPALDG